MRNAMLRKNEKMQSQRISLFSKPQGAYVLQNMRSRTNTAKEESLASMLKTH